MHSPKFKAKAGLEALRGVRAIKETSQEFGVHRVPVSQWKKEIQPHCKILFESNRGPAPAPLAEHTELERLYREIGRLKIELGWLKTSGIGPP